MEKLRRLFVASFPLVARPVLRLPAQPIGSRAPGW